MTVPERPEAALGQPASSRSGDEAAPANLDDHVRRNRAAWNADTDGYQARNAAAGCRSFGPVRRGRIPVVHLSSWLLPHRGGR
jgi:hypothetical protein